MADDGAIYPTDSDEEWLKNMGVHGIDLGRFHLAEDVIGEAAKLRTELELPASQLRDYIAFARRKAIAAVVALIEVDPQDVVTIFKLQRDCAAFRDVDAWVSDIMIEAEEATGVRDQLINAAEVAEAERVAEERAIALNRGED